MTIYTKEYAAQLAVTNEPGMYEFLSISIAFDIDVREGFKFHGFEDTYQLDDILNLS